MDKGKEGCPDPTGLLQGQLTILQSVTQLDTMVKSTMTGTVA